MVIVRTPYRVSFFGGGSDLREWYEHHGGNVLTSTISKYCYICARPMPPFLGTKYRVFWSKMEAVDRIEDIQHPAVRAALEWTCYDEPFEVNHAGDLPARSGLGSSSAFSVGILHAIYALQGNQIIQSKQALAAAAVVLEQNVMRERVGLQDQVECAYGGLNSITFDRSGDWEVKPLPRAWMADLEPYLMLFYTGLQRTSSDIQKDVVAAAHNQHHSLHEIQRMVPQAIAYLSTGKLNDFGQLLHEAWILKQRLSTKISTAEIFYWYEAARHAGALGGKILGAGGGGFMLLYCPPERQAEVRSALSGLLEIPFRFEDRGTQLLVCDR